MEKRILLIKVIKKVGEFLPEFLWFIDLLENNLLDDEFIDLIISHLEIAINKTKSELNKYKLEKTKNILNITRTNEKKDDFEKFKELQKLESFINNF